MDKAILLKVARRQKLDENTISEYNSIDKMVKMQWEMPDGLKAKEWAVKFVSPLAHNAEKTACNIFDTYHPKWDILPYGPEDKDTANDLETFLEWHMDKAGSHGEAEPNRLMMVHSVRYNKVCVQFDYLPYWLDRDKSKWTDEQKEQVSQSAFCEYIHLPHNVRYEMGSYGLRWVALVVPTPAANVIDYWKAYSDDKTYGKKIKSAIAKIEALLEEDPEATVVLLDYTDKDRRYVACWEGDEVNANTLMAMENGDVIEILSADNKIGFINWVIVSGSSDSLLSVLHRGDLWVNLNRTGTIQRSNTYRTAFPVEFIKEGTGGDVEVDYSGDTNIANAPLGTKLTPVPQRPIDPAFNELLGQDTQIAAQSVGIQNLASLGSPSNVQYATINAWIEMMLNDLEPYKRTVEKIQQSLGMMVFKWIKATGTESTGYYKNKTKTREAGYAVSVGPEDFDYERLHIEVKLLPASDKMQFANMIGILKQNGLAIPDKEFVERLGFGNPEVLEDMWMDEQVDRAALQTFIEKMKMEVQIMAQQAQMAMQQQGQANAPQGQPAIPQGQGFNPANGGTPPAVAAPQMTRTQMQ